MKTLLKIKDHHIDIDGNEILKGLDLVVHDHELHVIMGPNGKY